jgi:hypothetical protein
MPGEGTGPPPGGGTPTAADDVFNRPKTVPNDDFHSPLSPPDARTPVPRPTPAPAWVALLAAWVGLLSVVAAGLVPLLPGSADPRAELERAAPYSLADRFLPVPLYGTVVAVFLGVVVLWQSRREPRPLPDPLVAQRVQAWVGIALGLAAAAFVYGYVALRGPP